jgi:hypothetical protein
MRTKNTLRIAVTLFLLAAAANAGSKTSASTGSWDVAGTWSPSGVPSSTDDVIIANGHTVTTGNNENCQSLTINAGGTLSMGGTFTLTIANGGVFTNSGSFNAGSGTVELAGSNTISGTVVFASVRLTGNQVDFGSSSTINGDLAMYPGGNVRAVLFNSYGPTYGPNSRLLYNGNSSIYAGNEWYYNTTSGVGVPQNVEIFGDTVNILAAGYRYVRGNLTIDATGGLQAGSDNSGNEDIYIAGNWTNNGSFVPSTKSVIFNGSGTQTIAGSTTFYGLQVNNSAGVNLSAAVSVTHLLTLSWGTLSSSTTNLVTLGSSATVAAASSISYVNGPVANTWTTSTATKVFPTGKVGAYRPLELTLTTPSSPVIRAEVFNANAGGNPGSLNAISILRYYQTSLLSGSGTSGGTAKITFGGDDAVTSGQEGNLVVAQSTTVNGTYASLGQSANTATSVTSSSYNPGSGNFLLLGSSAGNSLPVQLASFLVQEDHMSAHLHWSTATETNNYGFEIERRRTANWEKVGFVTGAGTSNAPRDYSYTDQNLSPGRYAYRIKQIDKQLSFRYAGEVEVEVGLAPKVFNLVQNYPNPFNPSTTIEFSVPQNGRAVLKVIDLLGREVATLFEGEAKSGYYQHVVFDATKLASGVYFSRLEFGGKQQLKKIVLIK